MSIGSVNRVVMRKLASSKIFDLTISYRGAKGFISPLNFFDKDLSQINSRIKFELEDLKAPDINGLAYGGHISQTHAYTRGLLSKKFYRLDKIRQTNDDFIFDAVHGTAYVLFRISTNKLSAEDFEEILSLGLSFSKYDSYILDIKGSSLR
jgi:hypothetical protein